MITVYLVQVQDLKYIQNTELLGIMITKVLALVIVRHRVKFSTE